MKALHRCAMLAALLATLCSASAANITEVDVLNFALNLVSDLSGESGEIVAHLVQLPQRSMWGEPRGPLRPCCSSSCSPNSKIRFLEQEYLEAVRFT